MENSSQLNNYDHSKKQSFDYTALDMETQIIVQKRTGEIKSMMRKTIQETIEIGEKLIEVKQYLGFGHFGNWLLAEFDWKERTARNFMRVAEVFKSANFADLFVATSALYLLAAPSTPESARQEALELASLGEQISYSRAKSIISQHQKLENLDTSSHNVPPTINNYEVTSTEADLTTSPANTPREDLQELQATTVSSEPDEDILGWKNSAENLTSPDIVSSDINEICRLLINHAGHLSEDEATGLVKAIATHWSIENILEEFQALEKTNDASS